MYNECDTMVLMAKTAFVTAWVEKKLKTDAEKVLKTVGVRPSAALTMLYRQVVIQQGIPFEVRIPNKETRAAMRELDRGSGKRFGTVEALFEDALGKNWRKKVR